MLIGVCYCDWKCCIESNLPITVCQNQPLSQQPNINVSVNEIFDRYTSNVLTSAIIFGGLEPFLQFKDVIFFIKYFRSHGCKDDIVIYTGYYPFELNHQLHILKQYKNIIIKYGRYLPNQEKHYDSILGVDLASNNQYAERIN